MHIKLAEKMLAACLKNEFDFYQKHIEPLLNENKDTVIPEKIQKEFEELQDETEFCEDELASYPEIFEAMTCWMIEISGEGIKESIPDLSKIDVNEFIDQYGNLAHEVIQTLRKEDIQISNLAGTKNSWNIGILCTDTESKRLCAFLHEKFKSAIELRLMIIYKKFWNHRFSNLYDWDSLQEWLKTNTID